MKKIFKHLRAKIIAGFLVILPLGITIFILKFVFTALDNFVWPLGPQATHFLFQREVHIPGLGIIIFFLLLYLLGIITTNVIGRKLVNWGDRIFTAIPIVKKVYSASKQLTEAFSINQKASFRQAVFVEFPQKGTFSLGLITNELVDLQGQPKVVVFVPTHFIPPSGFLLFLPKEEAIPSSLTIEEALKVHMSLGIVTPQGFSVSLSGVTSNKESVEHLKRIKYFNPNIEGGS